MTSRSSSASRVKRALRASWALRPGGEVPASVGRARQDRRWRAPSTTGRRGGAASAWPRSPAKRLSPAQNEGSNGVTGDCSVAKKAVRSGSDWTSSSRSGRMKRSSITSATAKTRPISISTSRARRAGKTLTRPSVTTAPSAQGMTTNGSSGRDARSGSSPAARSARGRCPGAPAAGRPRPSRRTGPRCARSASGRGARRGTGAGSSSRRSSERKKVLSEVTTALKATKDRKVRNSQPSPRRTR